MSRPTPLPRRRRPGTTRLFVAAGLLTLLATTPIAALANPTAAVDTSRLADGDVIFHTSRSGQSEAIQLATDSPWSHMGLLFERADGWYVLEAIATVRYTPEPVKESPSGRANSGA